MDTAPTITKNEILEAIQAEQLARLKLPPNTYTIKELMKILDTGERQARRTAEAMTELGLAEKIEVYSQTKEGSTYPVRLVYAYTLKIPPKPSV